MLISLKGQITIPEKIRKKYGLLPHTHANFIEEKGKVYLIPSAKQTRGHLIVNHLSGTASVRITTDKILALTRGKIKDRN